MVSSRETSISSLFSSRMASVCLSETGYLGCHLLSNLVFVSFLFFFFLLSSVFVCLFLSNILSFFSKFFRIFLVSFIVYICSSANRNCALLTTVPWDSDMMTSLRHLRGQCPEVRCGMSTKRRLASDTESVVLVF